MSELRDRLREHDARRPNPIATSHADTRMTAALATVRNLGRLYWDHGKLKDAEDINRIREGTGTCLNSL